MRTRLGPLPLLCIILFATAVIGLAGYDLHVSPPHASDITPNPLPAPSPIVSLPPDSLPIVYSCETAREHQHTQRAVIQGIVGAWNGCELTIELDHPVTVFGGFEDSQKPSAVGQYVRVEYDPECGQVYFAMFPDDPTR